MTFKHGQHYEAPDSVDPPEWFAATLERVRGEAVGDVEIIIDTLDGGKVKGYLDDGTKDGAIVVSDRAGEMLTPVEASNVKGFMLKPDPPIDHSDELGR